MPVDVLDAKTIRDQEGAAVRRHIDFEIWEAGGPHYLYSAGDAPLSVTNKAQAEVWLLNDFDRLLAGAMQKGVLAPVNLLDNPNIDWRKVLFAVVRVILGQINALRRQLDMPEVDEQQALSAIKTQYRELD